MKNKPYQPPQILIVELQNNDLIRTSDPYDDGNWTIIV